MLVTVAVNKFDVLADVIDEYLDAYHSIDTSVALLMRSLRDNPPGSADTDDDDDYEEDDYYDDDYDDDNDDDTDESDDEEQDDDHYIFDKFDDQLDDRSEEEEDESVLDDDVDRHVESKDVNREHNSEEDLGTCALLVVTQKLVHRYPIPSSDALPTVRNYIIPNGKLLEIPSQTINSTKVSQTLPFSTLAPIVF